MPDALRRPLRELASPARMTRCECADLEFEEARHRIAESGLGVDEALRREGCGQTCTACVSDLLAYLRCSRSGRFLQRQDGA